MRKTNSSYPVHELSAKVQGNVIGDNSLLIQGLCALETPQASHLAFIRTRSAEQVSKQLAKAPAMAILVAQDMLPKVLSETAASVIVVTDPYNAFLDLLPLFFEQTKPPPGIHPSAIIAEDVVIGAAVSIGAHCNVAQGSIIGDNSILHPHVRIYEGVTIGRNVELFSGVRIREGCILGKNITIHDNSVIGADGFGYTPDPRYGIRKVPQVGHVEIGDRVEIGANTCIDRGSIGATTIGAGTKIDNLVQIGHNVTVGENCLICAHVAIGGSAVVGAGVIIGGASGVADHTYIAAGTRVAGWCGVTRSITEPGDYMGNPPIKAGQWRRLQVRLKQISEDRAAGRKATRK